MASLGHNEWDGYGNGKESDHIRSSFTGFLTDQYKPITESLVGHPSVASIRCKEHIAVEFQRQQKWICTHYKGN